MPPAPACLPRDAAGDHRAIHGGVYLAGIPERPEVFKLTEPAAPNASAKSRSRKQSRRRFYFNNTTTGEKMKVRIKTTGEIKTLTLIQFVTGIDATRKVDATRVFLENNANAGEFPFSNKAGEIVEIHEKTFKRWQPIVEEMGRLLRLMYALKKRYGGAAVGKVLNDNAAHLQEMPIDFRPQHAITLLNSYFLEQAKKPLRSGSKKR